MMLGSRRPFRTSFHEFMRTIAVSSFDFCLSGSAIPLRHLGVGGTLGIWVENTNKIYLSLISRN